jgi:hypothetical protein
MTMTVENENRAPVKRHYARQVTNRPLALLVCFGLIAAGCGGKPSAPSAGTCTDANGPRAQTVQQAISGVWELTADVPWVEKGRGHTTDCRLYWVQIGVADATSSTPGQLLFFDHDNPLGTATPDPRPYTTVLSSGKDLVTVQYQWVVGNDAPCCPRGVGTVRFQIAQDGALTSLDPIPSQTQ